MIVYDERKDAWLKAARKVSFKDFARLIEAGSYIDIIENPAYGGQYMFIICYNDYTYAVPYYLDQQDNIILKTIYPSRKYHKMYGMKS